MNDIYGYVKFGFFIVFMGVFGVGKIILFDVFVFRKNIGVIEGDVLMNGWLIGIGKWFYL